MFRRDRQLLQPLFHLPDGMSGECDGENFLIVFEMGNLGCDAVRERVRLARSGTGDDEQMPAAVFHRLLLGTIERE